MIAKNKNNKLKVIDCGLAITVVAFVLLLAVLTMTVEVSAQTVTTTAPTATCDDVFLPCIEAGGEFVIPIVNQTAAECVPSSARACVNIVYASSTIVVLSGETIPEVQVGLRSDNHMIWRAVNQIRAQGYSIQSVSITGSGLEVNPYEFIVVMAKP